MCKKGLQLITVLTVVVLATVNCIYAQITLPSIIGDNMVVKRNSIAKIWGWNASTEEMYVVADWDLSDTVKMKCDRNAKFFAELKTPDAGGPYTIKIVGKKYQKVITNVLVGEVWLCSGQSNMQMSLSSLYGTKVDFAAEMAMLNNPNIRTFRVPLRGADYPQNDCTSSWEMCSTNTISDVSLTAYFFAKKLEKELGVPVGIVMSSWGGTNAEVWIPGRMQENNEPLDKCNKIAGDRLWKPTQTAKTYNSMIYPLVPFNFSGALWYQGEANVPYYQYYDSIMRSLITGWREDFNADMPFYFVQIAPHTYSSVSQNKAAYLREQQLKTASMENCGMVVINDIIEDVTNIHPKSKPEVGARLADMALDRHYAKSGYCSAYPEVKDIEIKDKKAIVTLTNCEDGIVVVDAKKNGFKIAGEDGVFVDADMKVEGDALVLSSKSVKAPVYVRYLFDDSSVCGVKGANGLPLVPFRNDNL
ncbi:MAG: sialate O-acetylesterase [Rikenellaceae bacterium]